MRHNARGFFLSFQRALFRAEIAAGGAIVRFAVLNAQGKFAVQSGLIGLRA